MKKNCLVCKKEFKVSQSRIRIGRGKYCSKVCRWKEKSIFKKCLFCDKEFKVWKSRQLNGRGNYDSRTCFVGHQKILKKGKKPKHFNLEQLMTGYRKHIVRIKDQLSKTHKGKKVSIETRKKIRDASIGHKLSDQTKEKISNALKGENASSWRGGITPIRKVIRSLREYSIWRETVFKRDNYKCQECGIRGGELNVDHIKQFALIVAENNVKTIEEALRCGELWDINNGQTLCVPCHKFTNTYCRKIEKGAYNYV